jgi:hypothetical protein
LLRELELGGFTVSCDFVDAVFDLDCSAFPWDSVDSGFIFELDGALLSGGSVSSGPVVGVSTVSRDLVGAVIDADCSAFPCVSVGAGFAVKLDCSVVCRGSAGSGIVVENPGVPCDSAVSGVALELDELSACRACLLRRFLAAFDSLTVFGSSACRSSSIALDSSSSPCDSVGDSFAAVFDSFARLCEPVAGSFERAANFSDNLCKCGGRVFLDELGDPAISCDLAVSCDIIGGGFSRVPSSHPFNLRSSSDRVVSVELIATPASSTSI